MIKKEDILQKAKKQYNPIYTNDIIPDKFDMHRQFTWYDSQGYMYYLSHKQLDDKTHAMVKSHNPYSINNIENFIRLNKGTCELLSKEWFGADNKLTLKCACGREYKTIWYHIYSNKKFQCNKCGYNIKDNFKQNQNKTDKLCRKHGYTLLDGCYTSRKCFDMKDKNGYKYSNCSIYNLSGRTDKFARFNTKNKYQMENLELFLKLNDVNTEIVHSNNDKLFKDGYIQLRCVECNSIFDILKEKLICRINKGNNIFRCRKCTKRQSLYEYYIEDYLKLKNISYIKEKRFSWCKHKRELPFDFYLPDYNTVLEIHGSQHYYENTNLTMTLKEQQERDKFKKQCCIDNDINYVEIPYWLITQSRIETYKTTIDNIIC